jgi:predicted metal-binding membrane protein
MKRWRGWLQRPGVLAVLIALVPALLAWGWMLGEARAKRQWSCCHPQPTTLEEARGWGLMVLAMMLPFTLPTLRRIAERSYRHQRLRVLASYTAGYLGVWLLPLAAVLPLRQYPLSRHALLATALCLAAAAWTFHPLREKLFQRCHRQIPLRPLGWPAVGDAFRQGGVHGFPCLAGCLPLMLACTVTQHHMVMMAGGLILTGVERRMFRFRSTPLAVGALGLAGWTLLLA